MVDRADVERAVMGELRGAGEPVRESVLHERLRADGLDIAPDGLIAVLEHLAVQGHLRVSVEHELPTRENPPFEARWWRVVE